MEIRLQDLKIKQRVINRKKQSSINLNDLPKDKKDLNEKEKIDAIWNSWIEKGIIDKDTIVPNRNYAGINNFWYNEPCFIIAAGKALEDFIKEIGFDALNNKHTIGINHVIEDYDKFEWFLFLDQRFLEKTTYDMNNFKGRIFAQNKCNLNNLHQTNSVLFKTTFDRLGLKIEDGLYNGNLSGLAALNLALISGANPIYMLGYGEGKNSSYENYHYKKNYTGEVKDPKIYKKFQDVKLQYNKFSSYKNRIIHVTEGNDIPVFKKMRIQQFKNILKPTNINNKQQIKKSIAHLSFSNDINLHADITREVIHKCVGTHTIHNINNEVIPHADCYMFEHFISTKVKEKDFPYKNKGICIVHTTNCIPSNEWKKIICLTEAWKQYLIKNGVDQSKIETVKGGINISEYKDIAIDYNNKVFGRITRYSPGKIHPEWNRIVKELLDANNKSKCIMYTQLDNIGDRKPLQHERMLYDKSVQITDFKGQYLKNMSIYVHANGYFKETMSHAIIEAMATGLAIVYLKEPAIDEIVGDCGIACKTIDEVKNAIQKLLDNPVLCEELGKKALQKVKNYDIRNFVENINRILQDEFYINV